MSWIYKNKTHTVSTRQFCYSFIFVLIFGFMIYSCGNDKESKENAINQKRGQRPGNSRNEAAIPVQAVAAKRGDISRFLMQTTTIEAERMVDIVAKVSGEVVELPAEEGMRVKKGDLLARLDEAELTINYMRTKVSYETDKSVYERSQEMLDKNFIAKEDYEATRLQYESSKAAFEAARLQLGYTKIKAPFGGVVTTRNIELGQRVNVNQSLFVLADFNPLRAKIYVPEKDIGQIYKGQTATITVEAAPGREFKGVVKMVSPVVDPQSGTLKVTIDINEDGGKLKPGMFASVFITTETHENALIIPKRALVLETDIDQVYIYRDGTAHKVNLELGFSSGDDVEVMSGLQEGDLVVTAGQDGLREGLPIRVPGQETTSQPTTLANNTDSKNKPAQNARPPIDAERLKKIEQRMLQNPMIKKEYEKRLKADPDLANNPSKKVAFFREMRNQLNR